MGATFDSPERRAERGRGPQGPQGARGNSMLHGAGAPGTSVGVAGDFYMDILKWRIYGPKIEAGWPASFTQLSFASGLDQLTQDIQAIFDASAKRDGSNLVDDEPQTFSNHLGRFKTVSALLASAILFDATGVVTTSREGFNYEVAPIVAVDEHLVTAGGMKLYVLPDAAGRANIKAFGAVGNGVADDTAAVRLAETSEISCELFAPKGTYKLTSTVDDPYGVKFEREGTQLIGANRFGTRFVFTAAAANHAGVLITADHVHVKGLTVDLSANSTVDGTGLAAGCSAIKFQDCNNSRTEDCHIIGGHFGYHLDNDTDPSSPTYGEYTTNFFNSVINCSSERTASSGVHMLRSTGTLVTGGNFKTAGTDGIKTGGLTRRARIIANDCGENKRDGIDVYDGFIESICAMNLLHDNLLQGLEAKGTHDGTDYVVRDSAFIGNIATRNGVGTDGGVTVHPQFQFTSCRNCLIEANQATYGYGDGMALNNVQGCSGAGNVLSRNAKRGLFVDASVSRVHFGALEVIDNSWDDGVNQNGLYPGVYITAGSTVSITGGGGGNGTTTGKRGGQSHAVYFADGAVGSRITGFDTFANLTSGFGGAAADWHTTNYIISGTNNGTHLGLRLTGSGLNTLSAAANLELSQAGANTLISLERQGGAKLTASAQSTSAQIGTQSNHNWDVVVNASTRFRFTTNAQFLPIATGTNDIGSSTLGMRSVYITTSLLVNNVQVVGARKTGWAVDTGTAKRTANATYAVGSAITGATGGATIDAEARTVIDALIARQALIEAALRDATQTIKALKDDLHGTAGHGLIGT